MPSFGEKLKLEREKRSISLEQISSSTKIGTRMLQALEEEKFNQLPGGIFNKGFVRAYARTVGLDEDQAVADYLQASGEGQPARPELVTRENASREAEESRVNRLEAISDSPSRPLPWGVFAVILLAIALGLSLWSHRRREQERLATPARPASTTPESSGASSPHDVAATPTGAAQPSAAGAEIRPAPVRPSPVPPGEQARAAEKAPASQNADAPLPGEFTVVLRAREQSWVSITADGKSSAPELLEAGSERSIRGRKEVTVRAGNAGGVDFLLNGKKLDVTGDSGQVKTVTIGPAGLVPNGAAKPTTP